MTREEILGMEAGRELDALVAEKVMGEKGRNGYDLQSGDEISVHRSYSSNISAAWEVLGIRQHDYFVKRNSKTGMFEVVIDHAIPAEEGKREWRHFTRAIAKSAPEAICKAVLLAVMNL